MSASSTSTSTRIEAGSAIVIKLEPAILVVPLIAVSPIFISTDVATPSMGDRNMVFSNRSSDLSRVA